MKFGPPSTETDQLEDTIAMDKTLKHELAPRGVLRVGVNLGNFLLVTDRAANGDPIGVSPDIGRALADRFELPVEFVLYQTPGEVADAATNDEWDIANIGAEPERARVITFSTAYCEIESTYLVARDSPIQSAEQVDAPGNRIAVYRRAAYGLWLTDHIEKAELVYTSGMDESVEVFLGQNLDALAGLRPRLIEDATRLTGYRVLPDKFSSVQQAIGTKPDRPNAARYIQSFVDEAIASGLVARLIDKHDVKGRLSVAPAR